MNAIKTLQHLSMVALLALTACVDTMNEPKTNAEVGPVNESDVIFEMGGMAYSSLSANDLGLAMSTLSSAPKLSAGASFPTGGSQALSKKSAGEEVISEEVDTSQIENGVVKITVTKKAPLYKLVESVWVKWDDKAKDDIPDNENIIRYQARKEFINGRIETADITDLDGDGIVRGEPQYTNKGRAILSVTNIFGVTEKTTIDLTAGEDKNFDTEADNSIIALHWIKTSKDGKKLGEAKFTDADGDGYLLTPGSPSVVELELFEADNIFKPLVKSSQLNLRMEIAHGLKDGKIIMIAGEEHFKNGRINRLKVVNANGNPIIRENDIVSVIITSDFPVTKDTMLSSEVIFVIDIGSGLQDSTDNLLHEVHVVHEKRFGKVKKAEFHFVAKDPVPHGEAPKNGKVDIEVVYRNGKTWTLTGAFDEGMLNATLTGPEGNTLSVQWDENGKAKEPAPL